MKTKKRITELLKLIAFGFLLSISNQSCQKEEIIKNEQILKATFSEINNIKELKPLIKSIKNQNLLNNNENSFGIDTVNISQTIKGNVANYSFKIKQTLQNSDFKEKFITSKNNEEFSYSVLTFLTGSPIDDIGLSSIAEMDNSLIYIPTF